MNDTSTPAADRTLGQNFVDWLKAGITSHKLIINDVKALIHTVDDTSMLVTPGIFKRYVQEHPYLEQKSDRNGTTAWQQVQRAFEKERLHQKTGKQLNIWTFNVTGPRKTKQLKGYLLKDPTLLFHEQPFNNPSLSRTIEGPTR